MALCAAAMVSSQLETRLAMGPVVCLVQSAWAWWLLQENKALPPLTSATEEVREKHAGWFLDGVLVAPALLLLALWLGQRIM
jgi:hypothetical protein